MATIAAVHVRTWRQAGLRERGRPTKPVNVTALARWVVGGWLAESLGGLHWAGLTFDTKSQPTSLVSGDPTGPATKTLVQDDHSRALSLPLPPSRFPLPGLTCCTFDLGTSMAHGP
jgi:hypothetical protein